MSLIKKYAIKTVQVVVADEMEIEGLPPTDQNRIKILEDLIPVWEVKAVRSDAVYLSAAKHWLEYLKEKTNN